MSSCVGILPSNIWDLINALKNQGLVNFNFFVKIFNINFNETSNNF